jgi:hypothetical protein
VVSRPGLKQIAIRRQVALQLALNDQPERPVTARALRAGRASARLECGGPPSGCCAAHEQKRSSSAFSKDAEAVVCLVRGVAGHEPRCATRCWPPGQNLNDGTRLRLQDLVTTPTTSWCPRQSLQAAQQMAVPPGNSLRSPRHSLRGQMPGQPGALGAFCTHSPKSGRFLTPTCGGGGGAGW